MAPIRGFEGIYSITLDGRVWSHPRTREDNGQKIGGYFRKSSIAFGGYIQFNLYKGNQHYQKKAHRLVAEAFIPNPNSLPEVNHKNGDKNDNRVENLEWCDRRENLLHKIHVLGWAGEKHSAAKLKLKEVKTIRRLRANGFKLQELADRFNVSIATISRIDHGLRWSAFK